MIGLILVIVLQYLTVLLDFLEIKCMHVNTITCTTASIQACSSCKLGGGCFSPQRTFTLVSVWIMQLSYIVCLKPQKNFITQRCDYMHNPEIWLICVVLLDPLKIFLFKQLTKQPINIFPRCTFPIGKP